MEINRKQILKSVLDVIKGISDKDYQRRVWINNEGPEWDDFVETVCNFFGDGDEILEHYQDFELTEDQYRILKIFRDNFRIFSKKNDFPELFIDTLEWDEITKMAKEVLKVFNYQPKK